MATRVLSAVLLTVAMPMASLALPASAQPADSAGSNPPATTRSAKPSPQQQRLYRGTKIVGAAVRDAKDKKIGEIMDLLLDGRRGEVAYAVVSFGGTVGAHAGRKWHAIPWQALEPSDDGRYYVLHADRETISQAPGFDKGKWPDIADPQWSADTDRYWSRMVGRGPLNTNRLTSGASGAGNLHEPNGAGAPQRSDMDSSGR